MTRRRLLATLAFTAPFAFALGALIMHVSYSSQGKGPVGTLTTGRGVPVTFPRVMR